MKDKRRQFERFRCDIEVGVIGNNGEAVISETFDISEEGIFLMIPVASVAALMQSGLELLSGERVEILLPSHDQSVDLPISCSIVHEKVLIDGSYLVGIHFLDHDDEVKAHITDLIGNLK